MQVLFFIAAINEYDQKLYEDESVYRMLEALSVFQSSISEPSFEDKPVILFLNKTDLLQEKLKRGIDPSVCFPEYKGGCDLEAAQTFIQEKFEELMTARAPGKDLYVHFVTAIDTENLERVWNDCRHMMMESNLHGVGIL